MRAHFSMQEVSLKFQFSKLEITGGKEGFETLFKSLFQNFAYLMHIKKVY